jgi:hypothetical protein
MEEEYPEALELDVVLLADIQPVVLVVHVFPLIASVYCPLLLHGPYIPRSE